MANRAFETTPAAISAIACVTQCDIPAEPAHRLCHLIIWALLLWLLALSGCAAPELRVEPRLAINGSDLRLDAQAYYARGKEHLATRRLGLAAESFRAALAIDRGSVDALNGLGATYDRLGRFDLADRYYQWALQRDPASVATLNNIGWSHLLRGNRRLGMKFLDQARAVNPEHPIVLANLQRGAEIPEPAAPAGGDSIFTQEDLPAVSKEILRVERTGPTAHQLRTAAGDASPPAPASSSSARHTPTAPPPTLALPMIEVSNGTGLPRMAARISRYLRAQGANAAWLSNASHFGHPTTILRYREGWFEAAQALAAQLPAAVQIQADLTQSPDLHVLLGADLIDFDHTLQKQQRK